MALQSQAVPLIVDFNDISGVPCPCGSAQRAFADPQNTTCTLHTVTISKNAETHYHKTLTEVYYFLEGEGHMELNGESLPVKQGMAVLIPPGVRHRAVAGAQPMKILNYVTPPFDPADEWLD
jgi:mannose-6-phosphate isomerase-like protein (cupin superfamily)